MLEASGRPPGATMSTSGQPSSGLSHMHSDCSFAKALLSPDRIALVGVSSNAKKNTARPVLFMRKHGYDGVIHIVNPGHTEVLGMPAYATLADVPGPVDHVFIMVAGEQVAELLEPCAALGARVVTVYSDGFGELGDDGLRRQEALVARARDLGLRLLGPNSIGSADVRRGCVLSVNAAFAADNLVSGHVSLVSQSGSMMGSLLSRAAARGFGFAKSVSVGNESDITVGEVVNALVDDDDTQVILLFLETIRESGVLGAALDRAWAAGKPVIVYKLGRSEQGSLLSQSHTGAIAGDDAAVDAFFRAHGVCRAHQLEALFESIPLIHTYFRAPRQKRRAPRLAVITTTGGGAATVVDNLGLRGLTVVAPPAEFIAHMAARGMSLRSAPVIDLTLAATSAQYKDLLEQLLRASWCDGVLSVIGSSAQFHPELAVQPLIEADKSSEKPLAAFLAPDAAESMARLRDHSIAVFRTPEACADGLAMLLSLAAPSSPLSHDPFNAPIWPADLPAAGVLNEYEAGKVLDMLGIQRAHSALLSSGLLDHGLSYPVVLKVCSRDILHKTEVGGVRVGVCSDEAFQRELDAMLSDIARNAPDATLEGVLVQRMESRLLELILGYRRDPLVGPTIMLGAGGVAAELLKDFSLRMAPVGPDTAREMIEEVRMTQLLRGYRNLPSADIEVLVDAIVRFSRLALLEQIEEAEINPLFVQKDRAVAVDALITLSN